MTNFIKPRGDKRRIRRIWRQFAVANIVDFGDVVEARACRKAARKVTRNKENSIREAA